MTQETIETLKDAQRVARRDAGFVAEDLADMIMSIIKNDDLASAIKPEGIMLSTNGRISLIVKRAAIDCMRSAVTLHDEQHGKPIGNVPPLVIMRNVTIGAGRDG